MSGISGSGGGVSDQPPAPRVAVRTRTAPRRSHAHDRGATTRRGPLPLDTGFLVHNDRTYPESGAALRRDRRRDAAVRHVVLVSAVRRPGSSTAAAAARVLRAGRRNRRASVTTACCATSCDSTVRRRPCLTGAGRARAGRWRLSRPPPVRRRVRRTLSGADGVGDLVGVVRRHPCGSRSRRSCASCRITACSVGAHPTWRVVSGGSHTYIPRLIAPLDGDASTERARLSVDRSETRCHADVSRIARPARRRRRVRLSWRPGAAAAGRRDRRRARRVLGTSRRRRTRPWLHTDDAGAAGSRRGARASWNYRLGADPDAPPSVTYDLNRLQGIPGGTTYCVTLNPRERDRRRSGHSAGWSTATRSSPSRACGAGTLARGQRRPPHPLLRRLLALRLPRGRAGVGAARRRGPRGALVIAGTWPVRRHDPPSPLRAAGASVPLFAVHGAARHRSHRRADGSVAADEPQPLELGVVRRSRSSRRSSRPLRERLRDSAAGAGRDAAGRPDLPADAPAVCRLCLQSDLALLLLRPRRHAARWCSPTSATPTAAGAATGCGPRRRCRRHRFRAMPPKTLYVSPFMEIDVDYEFVLTPPGPSAGRAHERGAAADSASRGRAATSTRRCG